MITLTDDGGIAFMAEAVPECEGMPLDELVTQPGQSYAWIAGSYVISQMTRLAFLRKREA